MPGRLATAAATTVLKKQQKHRRTSADDTPYADRNRHKGKKRPKEDTTPKHRALPHQKLIKKFYDEKAIQLFVAFLIILNFVISAIEAQILPVEGKDDNAIVTFKICEYFFAYAFLIELALNFYGSFFMEFWASAWNIFDFLIVLISLLSLYMENLPGISVLRLFRAFRVVRLFKRIKTMRKMMDSILKSLPGMSIAFAALFLIMGIYGIIGVEFWKDAFEDEYGNFLKAVLSLLQIMTFDSWSSGIARKIIFADGAIAAIYFITYVFVASIIMANVLIALLLDQFMNNDGADDDEDDGMDDMPPPKSDLQIQREHEAAHRALLGGDSKHGLNQASRLLTGGMKADNVVPITDEDDPPSHAHSDYDGHSVAGSQAHYDIEMTNTAHRHTPHKRKKGMPWMRRKNSAADRHHHHGHDRRSASPPTQDHLSRRSNPHHDNRSDSRKQRAPGSSRTRADSRGYDSDGDPKYLSYIQNLEDEVANQERRGRERNHPHTSTRRPETLGEALNHSDPEWRAQVDDSINHLAHSLEKLHQKLDQILHLPPADLIVQERARHDIYNGGNPADRLEATDPNDEHQGSEPVPRREGRVSTGITSCDLPSHGSQSGANHVRIRPARKSTESVTIIQLAPDVKPSRQA